MARNSQKLNRENRGQAMVETALMLPFLLFFVFNAMNFGYFFLMAINVAAAPRAGVLYSILGESSAISTGLDLASPGPTTDVTSVSYLTLNDLTGAIGSGGAAGVQVCTAQSGTSGGGPALITNCTSYNSSPSYTPSPDPEAPVFVLNRVDVTYSFKPLLDQRLFNLVLLATPVCKGTKGSVTCTFHREVSMRAMN